MSEPRDHDDRESGFELVMGVLSLLFWSVVIVELLGITIVVGVTDIEPRPAALTMLFPALAIWLFGSFQPSWRRTALALFPPYVG